MPNTGTKIILTLKEVTVPEGVPTGNTKPNVPEDPDYIAPEEDSPDCPITADTSCPSVVYTGRAGEVEYEFSIPETARNNPAIENLKVKLMNGVTLVNSDTFNNIDSITNYYHDTLVASAGSYTIEIDYLDASNVVVATCSIGGVTIT